MRLVKIVNNCGKVGLGLSIAVGLYWIGDTLLTGLDEGNFIAAYLIGILGVGGQFLRGITQNYNS